MHMDDAKAPWVVVAYEDRPRFLIGLKLLIASLHRHHPEARVRLHCPVTNSSFEKWLARFGQVELCPCDWPQSGWNAKPRALFEAFSAGCTDVTWVDSDIIVAGRFSQLLHRDDREALVALEETPWGLAEGGTGLTRAWGLPAGRPLPSAVNSGVIRMTDDHRDLLAAWLGLLERPEYQQAQAMDYSRRPLHLRSDQDALQALLGSERFARVQLHYLRCGVDVVQATGPCGYGVVDRILSLARGQPPLVHALGFKPWSIHAAKGSWAGLGGWYEQLYQELSVYVQVARDYSQQLDEECPWMDVRTWAGRLCQAAARRHPALQGLPQAAFDGLARRLKRTAKTLRHKIVFNSSGNLEFPGACSR
jgi:hypothetical protein